MINTLKQLNQRPIAYYPIYRVIAGSTTAGIHLSQLMYWFSKKDKIYKTDKEIIEETMLSEKELRNTKKLIKKLDFITVSVEGVPAKTYYEIDWEKYQISIENIETKGQDCNSQMGETRNDQRAKLETTKGQDCNSQMGETNKNNNFNTETTTETTTDINKNKNKKSLQSKILEKVSEHIDNINASALDEWLEYKNYKSIAPVTKTINFLVKFDMNTQQQIVDNSIMNEYKGLFEPKQKTKSFNTPTMQTLNTDANVWDMIDNQQQRENQGAINGQS